ncbi:VWA domain-containing protein, partial [Streptomyces sp. NPDC091217]|uniref:VWA domain-containing protein n=1 Tax=Streptomyces sp. NPDC091217 TaxID=3365975 RepID=UPI003810A67D
TAEPETTTPEPVAETDTKPEPETEAAPEPEAEDAPAAEPEPTATAEPETTTPEPVAETDTKPEPETEAAPEPEAEVTPAAEPEPTATAEPAADETTTPEPDPQPEAGAAPEPQAEAVAEASVEAEAEVAPVAEAAPAAEIVAESTPESAPEAAPEPVEAAAETDTPEPAAADGESAPQGPPAPDNETVTGGAGGNDPAEGEAEAAVDSDAAATALAKAGLTGTRAATYLVLDRSASMRAYYKDGSAAALADQTLALAAHLTPDGDTPTVHVVFFSTEVDGTTDLTPASAENAIDEAHAGLGRMGRTSYHAAVEAVLAHYDKHHDKDATPATPALVVFQTDGAPDAKTPATQSLTDAAKSHPALFFSFVAFGEHENKAFDYLRKLKTDNTAFFHAGPTPLELTDAELYDGLLIDWRP